MSYGDPTRAFASGISASGLGVPAITYNNFYRVISAGPFPGVRALAQDPRTNTSNFNLPPKPDKVTTQFTIAVPLTVIGGFKELLSCVGAVATRNAGNYTLTVGSFADAVDTTVTATVDGIALTAQTGVAGAPGANQFQAAVSNDATATSLASALNGLAGITATATLAVVTVVPDDPLDTVDIAIGGPAPTGLTGAGSGAYKHLGTFSRTAANTRYFVMQADIDGRIYTIVDVRVHAVNISAAVDGPFPIVTLSCVGTFVTSAQFLPTGTPATYDGVLYAYGVPNNADAASQTYNVDVVAAGAIDGATATVRTQLSTDGGNWSTTRAPINGVPFLIYDGSNTDSGLRLIWTTGANNDLAGADSWTEATRGTVSSGSIASPTLFSWNNVEFDLLLEDGSTFVPRSWSWDLNLNLMLNLTVGGREVPYRFPPQGPATSSFGFSVWSQDAKYINQAWNQAVKAFRVRCRGQEIGSTGQFETVDLTIAYGRMEPVAEQLSADFLIFRDMNTQLHDSAPTASDAFSLHILNDVSSAVA